MNSFKTSDQGSTGNGKDLTPYWNPSCLELSQKLLSRTKTGSAGSDLNYWNASQASTIQGSWFSTTPDYLPRKNSCEISFPSSTYSRVAFTECENTLLRCLKIRVYLSASDRQKARKYFGLSRYWFNAAIEYLQQPGTNATLAEVRRIQKQERPSWAYDCPQRVREHAMSDACRAVKAAKIKCKKTGAFQRVAFRSRKDARQSVGFDKCSIGEAKVFSGEFAVRFQASEPIPEPGAEGTRLLCENGQFFVLVPVYVPQQKPENQRLPYVALDPGVRTFITFFCNGGVGKIGQGDFGRISRLCFHLDRLISRLTKATAKRRAHMKKAAARMRVRIKNLIDDLHKKAAVFLSKSFDTIFIPSFETSRMSQKLQSKTARMMLTFSHFRFRSLLQSIAEKYSAKVVVVNEAYTSKTCSYCGTIHKIGSKKHMECCGQVIDRDHNGARGIYLRALAASPSQSQDCVHC
jgi:putative transposase